MGKYATQVAICCQFDRMAVELGEETPEVSQIIDTFLYAGESDLLDLRMKTLDGVVDRFVAIESHETIQGAPRELSVLPAGVERIVVDDFPRDDWVDCHHREDHQRTGALRIDAAPDDFLLMGDVDEIPHPKTLKSSVGLNFVLFKMKTYYWAIDWYFGEQWLTAGARFDMADPFHMRARGGFFVPGAVGATGESGWHFSWLGGPEVWEQKLSTFSHPEAGWMRDDGWDQWYREGYHNSAGTRVKLTPVDVDDTYPAPILDGRFVVPEIWRRPRG